MKIEDDASASSMDPLAEFKKAADAFQENDIAKVMEIAEPLIKEAPEKAYGYILLGIIAEISNERKHAINMFAKAHELDPDCREVAEALAALNYLSGKITDGLYYSKVTSILSSNQTFIKVIPFSMRDFETAMANVEISRHFIEAMRAYEARQYGSCVDECTRELRLNSHHKLASELLGFGLLGMNLVGRSISAFQTAIHLNPHSPRATVGLGEALLRMGRTHDAASCFQRALQMDEIDPKILARCQRGLSRIPGVTPQDLMKPVENWYGHIKNDLPVRDKSHTPVKNTKLRVGIVSDMFYSNFLQPYLSPLLEIHDREKVEVRLYSLLPVKDTTTARIQNSAESWREIHEIDQFTLAETLRRENLDLVLDLCFEPDQQGTELFVVGAAAKQVTWFGACEAASILGMTHVLSDESTAPIDQSYITQGQVCINPSQGIVTREPFFAFDTSLSSPVAENKFVMFGMRADPAAITADDAFMIIDLLRSVPNARLLLGLVPRLDSETQERLVSLFSLGGAIGQIHFQELPGSQGDAKSQQEICQDFFSDVDIFLSPSTSVEFDDVALSLWMGAPAVVMQGNSRLGRLRASVLKQAGRGEWASQSTGQFIDTAKALAVDPHALAQLRETLRDQVAKSNLFTTPKVTTEIWNSLISICEA